MGVKRVVNFNYCCLVTLLILTGLSSLFSSPIPLMEDFLNHKSSALPSAEKGKLSSKNQAGLLGKQVLPQGIQNQAPARASLGSLTTVQNNFNLKSGKEQGNSDVPMSSSVQQALMKLRVSRPSSQGDLNLKPALKAPASSGLPLQSTTKRKQPWEYLPIKPEPESEGDSGNIPEINVKFGGSGGRSHTANSILPPTPHRQEMPLPSGTDQINLGRLNLKTDWCITHPFKETVRHHGCQSVQINNSMCYGQCNSFYIPKRFVSCSYCAPSRQEIVNVRLECPGQNPSYVIRKVKVVMECACKDCGLAPL